MAVEPVFLLRRHLPFGEGPRYDTLELCLAAERESGLETVLGAQEIRGLWRVYPLTRTAEDQWEDPQSAIADTQSEQPSQRVTVRQQSVTRKTEVSGKKQALDS